MLEYRVSWQREGLKRARVLRQTEAGARAKVASLLWSDTEKKNAGSYDDDGGWDSGGDYLRDMPDLVGPPTIECREVGEWAPVSDPSAGKDPS